MRDEKTNRMNPVLKRFRNIKRKIFEVAMYTLLIGIAFSFLFPFLYVFVTSIKSVTDLRDFTVNWIPNSIHYHNYVIALEIMQLPNYAKNSFIYTIGGTIGHLLSCSFIGYGFARYKYPGKNILFILLIIALVIPVHTLITPLYITFARLKWLNTFLPVVVPTFFGFGLMGPLFTFIFRQFYLRLPTDLENAARIDGCSVLRIYWNIVFPLSRAAYMVVFVLSMIWHWNDFYEPTIYSSRHTLYPLTVKIRDIITFVYSKDERILELLKMLGYDGSVNEAVLMAGVMIVLLPVVLFFSVIQKEFMQGFERSGIVE